MTAFWTALIHLAPILAAGIVIGLCAWIGVRGDAS